MKLLGPVRYFSLTCALGASFAFAGCGLGPVASDSATPGVKLTGNVHGGQQAVSGAKIYLYSVSTLGYGYFSNSLLNGTGYVTTDANGGFNISQDYTCPAGSYVYLLAKGGNPGLYAGANNSSFAEMAALGPCVNLSSSTFININEVTTIATAYALSGFLTSDTAASTPTSNLTGMKNAFASYGQMIDPSSGQALAVPVATTGTVPQAEINTLADVLAACVNTDGTTGTCGNLSLLTGNSNDTANAAIYIAQHPSTNVAQLYSLVQANPPYQPTLAAAPNDWSIAITIDGGAFNGASTLAIDAAGNAWVGNTNLPGIVEIGPDGTLLSGVGGYLAAGFTGPYYITIDPSGNVWADVFPNGGANRNTLVKFSSAGTLLNPGGYTNACGNGRSMESITSDLTGNIWNTRGPALCEIDTNNNLLSPTGGWPGTSASVASSNRGLTVDSGGSIWQSGTGNTTVTNGVYSYTPILAKFASNGTAISPTAGYSASGYYFGYRMAIDASNNAWVPNIQTRNSSGGVASGSFFSFNSTGTATSPTGGYPATASPNGYSSFAYASFVDGSNRIWNGSTLVDNNNGTHGGQLFALTSAGASAVGNLNLPQVVYGGGFDSSGNLWIASFSYVMKVIGVGTPTITPLSQAALQNKIGQRP